jgi:3-hydroxybutyryl-CoA dehydrogenase
MNRTVFILGSGTMAREIGTFCLKRGYAVTWLSGTVGQSESIRLEIAKQARRMARAGYDIPDVRFAVRGEEITHRPDVIIECTSENIAAKLAAVYSVKLIPEHYTETLLLSASSSILPSDIHPRCIGCHFFYPVEITGIVELIQNPSVEPDCFTRALEWVRGMGLDAIVQTEFNAFAINRLLLTVQAEAMQLAALGYSARFIDEASKNELLPAGIFTMMDTVGFETLYSAAQNYIRRMPAGGQPRFQPLTDGLRQAIDAGKTGRKKGSGFLDEKDRPDEEIRNREESKLAEFREMFLLLFCASCHYSLKTGELSENDMETALKSVFNSECGLKERLAGYPADSLAGLNGRSGYLVRAVMQSIYNVGLMGHEAALKEENRLFDIVVRRVSQNDNQ